MSVSSYRSLIKSKVNLEEQRGVWLALLAVLCFSTAPILVIWADPLTPYEKAFGRLVVATLAVWILATAQRQPLRYGRRDWGKFLLFGLVAAIHFVSYIASFNFTTIAHALTVLYTGHTLYNASLRRTHATYVNLITSQEVTGGILLGVLLLGQMPSANAVMGAAITLAGVVLVMI